MVSWSSWGAGSAEHGAGLRLDLKVFFEIVGKDPVEALDAIRQLVDQIT